MEERDKKAGKKSKKETILEQLNYDETVRLKLEELRLKKFYSNSPWHISRYLEDPECFWKLLGGYIPAWTDLMEDQHIAALIDKSPALQKFRSKAKVSNY